MKSTLSHAWRIVQLLDGLRNFRTGGQHRPRSSGVAAVAEKRIADLLAFAFVFVILIYAAAGSMSESQGSQLCEMCSIARRRSRSAPKCW